MVLPGFASRAGNRTRTGDPNLGKVVLYQLSYSRMGDAVTKLGRTRGRVNGRSGWGPMFHGTP